MNRIVSKIGAAVVSATVFLFAVFLIFDMLFWSYLVCMFLAIGYVILAAGLQHESTEDRRVAANAGLAFAAVYAVLILIVYFAQTTSVRLEGLSEQTAKILDYRNGGLLFNYDLLGYGMMALSTFFIGLSMKAATKLDKWLKIFLMVHGVFFLSCFIMPMTGVFTGMSAGGSGKGGTIALVIWCAYFLPIGVLAFLHFGKKKNT